MCAAPVFALDPRQPLVQLHHTSWTARDGLQGTVWRIAQTSDGYLWVGTSDGLFRFDGLSFERYRPEVGSLQAVAVYALMAVPDGGLWVGYAQGGASFIKNGRTTNYSERDGLPIGNLRGFALDHDGTVWAAATGGLARLEGERWRKVRAEWQYSCGSAWALFVDRQGTLWVGGASPSKLMFLPKGAKAFQEAGIPIPVTGFAEAPDGTVWMLDEIKSQVRALPSALDRSHGPWPVLHLSTGPMLFDRDGALWIASDYLSRWPFPSRLGARADTSVQREIETLPPEHGLTGSSVNDVFEDREGNIWLGTEGGLDRLRYRNVSWSQLRSVSAQMGLVAGDRGEVWALSWAPPYLMRAHDRTAVPGVQTPSRQRTGIRQGRSG